MKRCSFDDNVSTKIQKQRQKWIHARWTQNKRFENFNENNDRFRWWTVWMNYETKIFETTFKKNRKLHKQLNIQKQNKFDTQQSWIRSFENDIYEIEFNNVLKIQIKKIKKMRIIHVIKKIILQKIASQKTLFNDNSTLR